MSDNRSAEEFVTKLAAQKKGAWALMAARNHGYASLREVAQAFGFDLEETLRALQPNVSCQCQGVQDDE